MIELAGGDWRALLRPEIGGCIAELTCDGNPVLRTMADDAVHPLQSACFPLIPYCNRIAGGRFTWGGRTVEIAPNLAGQRHPLHGFGWLAEWRVMRRDATSALLEHDYDGSGEWPWPYVAHQHIALDESGCTVRLLVQNRAAEPAPMGLGVHPYFRRAPETTLTFAADAMLGIDAEFLPDGEIHPSGALAPWRDGALLPPVLADNCFVGWGGAATIADAQGTITLRGFGAPHCHVYAPANSGDFCLEPVNHSPDALNRARGEVPVVQPGCAAGIALRIEAMPG